MTFRPTSVANTRSRQRVRLWRFLLAGSFSLLYVAVLGVFEWAGVVDRATLFLTCAIVTASILAFLLVFLTGLNLRAPDPSLTVPQICAAVFTMLFVFHRVPETRMMFAAFFFVALTFGMLRSGGVRLTVLGAVSLAGYAAVSVLRHRQGGDVDVFRTDMLQLLALAVVLPWFVFVGSMARRLKDAERRKDDFLATLAHELRNPLAPVRTGVQILRREAAGSRGESLLPMMERQIAHITQLLDDLHDLSRIARGKTGFSPARVDLHAAVEDALQATAPLIAEMRHRFTPTLPTAPVMLWADPVRLTQILSNLLTNAAKYTPPGGRIELEARRVSGDVEVRVRDSGIGIPPERLKTIFEMYSQVECRSDRQRGGLGIGLAVVHELVRLHGGSIEARSEGEGRGSEFVLRLPALADEATGRRGDARTGSCVDSRV